MKTDGSEADLILCLPVGQIALSDLGLRVRNRLPEPVRDDLNGAEALWRNGHRDPGWTAQPGEQHEEDDELR